MIGLTREPRAKNRHKGDIVAMYVAPESRPPWLGTRAVAGGDRPRARRGDDLEQLVLTVTRTNEAAAQLYKPPGSGTFGVEPRAIKVDGEYFDKEHMILFL